jgi:hypothetical protein
MKASTLLEKVRKQRKEVEREQIVKELSALLVATPTSRKNAREYLARAISFIAEK